MTLPKARAQWSYAGRFDLFRILISWEAPLVGADTFHSRNEQRHQNPDGFAIHLPLHRRRIMRKIAPSFLSGFALLALVSALAWPLTASAQNKTDTRVGKSNELADQLAELRAKVARLEAALVKSQPSKSSGMPGMGMMEDDMMMGGMGDKKKGMGGMMDMDMMGGGMSGAGGGGMGMMEDDTEMMGMMGKGSMSGMGAKGMKMKLASALPGFPGASHIYHIGATDFFLDHPEHISLTSEQQTLLNKAKQKAVMEKAKAQRQIDEAERVLWELTGADEPDAEQIEAKVQEIEKLRGEQRLAFIRSVGEAANVLTDEQRQVLLGQAKSDAHKTHPAAAK
jgi:hypothetical protein